jgi:hypothetical protein
MCKGYDRDSYNPIEPTTIFNPSDTEAVCLTIVSLQINDTVDFRWYYRSDSSKTWVFCYNWSYLALFHSGEHAVAGYLNIRGYWPGIHYPRAYKVEVYHMSTSLLFSEFFEVTNGGLNSPRICENIDVNGRPVNMKSRFTIDNDTMAYHYLRLDKIAYFNEELSNCHNFTTVWIQPNGSTYKTHSCSFTDYKDENVTWNCWEYGYVKDDYITIDSSTPIGNWKVEVYLDRYFNNTWMPYGPITTTPFVVGSEPVADWTFMVYLDADNTLEGAGIDIFEKMASVGSSPNVSIVVQMDRHENWTESGFDDRYGNWSDCRRFYVTKDMTPMPENAIQNLTEVNMGDPATLRDFVNWTINNYPANYYFLVLWDHGTGCMGVCFDVTSGGDNLTLQELSQALSGLPAMVDVVFFDACSMAMTEVAYQLKDYANVLVGPEGLGYAPAPYDNYTLTLTSNSSMLPTEFAKKIVTNYIDWCWSFFDIPNATMSATDLTKIMSLTIAIDDFAINLKEKETPYHKEISLARNQTAGYQGPFAGQTGHYIDLYNFTQQVYQHVPDEELRKTAEQVMVALSMGNVIIIEADKVDPNSYGLSIFFPDTKTKYDSLGNSYENAAFAIDTPWDEFVRYHLFGYVLTIQTPYPDILVNVNETSYKTDAKGKIPVFVLPDYYTVNVTTTVSTGLDSRGVFTQWNDSDASNPRTLFINAETTLEAEYTTQYRLIINTNFGTTDPPVGEYWYNATLTVEIRAIAPTVTSGEQYSWLGWTEIGDGSHTSNNNPVLITMDRPINETAAWRHEYYLTVTSPYGSPTPTSGWSEAGKSLNVSVTSPVSGTTGTQYVCTGWTGTGSVSASGTDTFVTFEIDSPSSITWNWKTQYLFVVRTDPAGISPPPNVSPPGPWYDKNTLVNCTALIISGYVFDHWTFDGVSWDVGINPVTVTIDGPYEATAHYVRERTWWETMLRPENLQVILGLVGTVITVGLVGTAWIRTRRKRGIVRTFLTEADEIYSRYKTDSRKCEEELYRLRNTILEGLTDGKITEESYNIVDKKIDKYMKELRKQKRPEAADG